MNRLELPPWVRALGKGDTVNEQKPSIGRIVHYVLGGLHFAALIVYVWPDNSVNLHVFGTGVSTLDVDAAGLRMHVTQDQGTGDAVHGHAGHSWHWPERAS